MFSLNVQPSTPPLSWEEFCQQSPPYSVALDGFVHGGPRWDLPGKRANFNHHEDVDRLATRSTCAQVLMAFRQGLDAFLHKDGRYSVNVFVNDCDVDVCLAVWMLKNPRLVTNSMNPRLNRLVHVEDMMDATGGAYPFHSDLPLLEQVAWVFEPYRSFRGNGLQKRDKRDFQRAIEDVGRRIDAHLMGTGGTIEIDGSYETLYHTNNWVMIHSAGPHARTTMFSRGILAFVDVRGRKEVGAWDYTVGKMTPISDFPVERILNKLNEREGLLENSDRWGGGDMIGGSPRVAGSKLSPNVLFDIINDVVQVKV